MFKGAVKDLMFFMVPFCVRGGRATRLRCNYPKSLFSSDLDKESRKSYPESKICTILDKEMSIAISGIAGFEMT